MKRLRAHALLLWLLLLWAVGVAGSLLINPWPLAWCPLAGAVVTLAAGSEPVRVRLRHRWSHFPARCSTGCSAARNRLMVGRARDRQSATWARDYLRALDRIEDEALWRRRGYLG